MSDTSTQAEGKKSNSDSSETDVVSSDAITYVHEDRVACDGGGGALGHPKVFYTLKEGKAECGYCDAKFVHHSLK